MANPNQQGFWSTEQNMFENEAGNSPKLYPFRGMGENPHSPLAQNGVP